MAGALVIEPTEGIYVVTTREYGGSPWYHHVTVDADAHCVDAMTGVDGHAATLYLDEFFRHSEALSIRPVSEGDWEWL